MTVTVAHREQERTEVHGGHPDGDGLVEVGDAERVEGRGADAVQDLTQHEHVLERGQPPVAAGRRARLAHDRLRECMRDTSVYCGNRSYGSR